MMEVTGTMSSARVNAPAELPSPEIRPGVQQTPAAQGRQPETIPGVSVQISAAAREAAARDALSASPEGTTATRPAAEVTTTIAASGAASDQAAAPLDAPETPDRAASGDGGSSAQSAQARQAVQMFTETAGIGVNQQTESPLRTSA